MSSARHPNSKSGLPWHWLLAATALLAAFMGAWTLWGPIPPAKRLPPSPRELFRLKEVADAADPKSLQYRQVMLAGRYTGHTVLLKDRDMAGRSGFYVLSPFREKGDTGLAVLVQVGWVPSGMRNLAENINMPRHDVLIDGRLAIPSLGTDAEAAGETGFIRRNLSLQGYAGEIGVPLIPLVMLQEPDAEWSEKDVRQDLYQRRWPELYPQDKNIALKGWMMLAAAVALAVLGFRLRPQRRQGAGSAFAQTMPWPEADADRPPAAASLLRQHGKIVVALGLVVLAAALLVLHYVNEFSRLKRVEIGNTPSGPSMLAKVVFRNDSSSKIEFPLRCHYKARSSGKALFSDVVVLPPNGSVELDVNPEHAGRIPAMVANKSCEAIWRGPFGIERSAWWVSWEHGKPSSKSIYD
jgi:surfeit locus 1 family protein